MSTDEKTLAEECEFYSDHGESMAAIPYDEPSYDYGVFISVGGIE